MHIRVMTSDDIAFGMHLSAQNRWNQLEADWRRQLTLQPDGCFLAESGDGPIGTACCCVFGAIAWINLVLVERGQRGRGVGTALMRHVVDHLDQRGVASIRLDATPLGQPVYEKLGFAGDFELTRLEGVSVERAADTDLIVPMMATDLPAVCNLDEAITKTPRGELLRSLFHAAPERARVFAPGGVAQGYALARRGANAWQLGPIQGSPDAGRALLLDSVQRHAGEQVYVDVPHDHAEAVALCATLGLTPQRSFLRMTRGRQIREELGMSWTMFGPEKG